MAEESSFDDALDDLDERLLALGPIAVGRGMEHISGVSAGLTPVETGHLVGARNLTVHGLEASLTFPGPYARYQHYMLDLRHTHGQALYLEQPMLTEADKALEIVTDTLREAF